MAELDHIITPVQTEFETFKTLLEEVILSEQPFMKPITRDILQSGGKQMRPLLTLLAARLHREINAKVLASAVLIEMIHWSTLVHDDVIDEAYVRRGEWTPGMLLRSKSAVLVGDYLFSKGLAHAAQAGSYRTISSATKAIELIVDGELMQMEHSRLMDTTEEVYTEIIRLKTGALLASAAECGAVSSMPENNVNEGAVANMYRFGELLGLAFQVKDDLLDYGFTEDGEAADTGKVLCNDLRERKMTLPLIYALSQTSSWERRNVLRHLRKAADSNKSVEWIQDFVTRSKGIDYSITVMEDYHDRALKLLEEYPGDGVAKQALTAYADYVVGRVY